MATARRYSHLSVPAHAVGPFEQISGLEVRNAELEETNRRLQHALERVQRLAYLDPLTGLGNRRYFDSVVPSELRRAVRARKPLTLFICDVDNFKLCNDVHGHDGGDALLIEVAHVLRTYCRRGGDLAIRYAGDEFALLLPGVQRSMAKVFADGLRDAVRRLSVPFGLNRLVDGVTLSIGGVTLRGGTQPCEAARLVTLADRALYRAKRSGRDRAVLVVCR